MASVLTAPIASDLADDFQYSDPFDGPLDKREYLDRVRRFNLSSRMPRNHFTCCFYFLKQSCRT